MKDALEVSSNDTKKHILVVDDEPIIRELLCESLRSSGYTVSQADNGLTALEIMAEKNFGMVLMDLDMPVMNGITAVQFLRKCENGEHNSLTEHCELAQALHSQRKGGRIPVVAVTGNVNCLENVLQAGMDEYISKPFSFSTIFAVVDRFCGLSREGAHAERRNRKRYQSTDNGIVLSKKIAGLVQDISIGGMSINIFDNSEVLPDKCKVNFYCPATETKIEGLTLKLVREESKKISEIGIETQIVGGIFYEPTALQLEQIKQHISR